MKKYTLYTLVCLICSSSVFAGIQLKLCQPKETQFFSCTLKKINKSIAFCGKKLNNSKGYLNFIEHRNGYRENYFPKKNVNPDQFFKYKIFSQKSTKKNETITNIHIQFKFMNKIYHIEEEIISQNNEAQLEITSQRAHFSIYKKNKSYKKVFNAKCKQDKIQNGLLNGSTASIIQYIDEGLFLNIY